MSMWAVYNDALRVAEQDWWEGDRPPEITAVAKATGLDAGELWDEVEGKCGWESHDAGYTHAVWQIAWGLKGNPDWAGVTGGDQPVGSA